MIFDFLKEKAIDRKEAIQDHILGVSILDRFLRFFATILAIILGYFAVINIPNWLSGGTSIDKWIIPVLLLVLLLDIFIFKTIIPFIWSLISSIIGMFFSLLGDILVMGIELAMSLFSGLFSLFIDLFSGLFSIFLGGGKDSQ